MMRHSFHHGENKKRHGTQRRKTHEKEMRNTWERDGERVRKKAETY